MSEQLTRSIKELRLLAMCPGTRISVNLADLRIALDHIAEFETLPTHEPFWLCSDCRRPIPPGDEFQPSGSSMNHWFHETCMPEVFDV